MNLLTYDDAAAELKVHPDTVRGYVRAGELAVVRLGRACRIRPEDLEAFVNSRRSVPAPIVRVVPPTAKTTTWEIARRGA